jgi:hypothetical protein
MDAARDDAQEPNKVAIAAILRAKKAETRVAFQTLQADTKPHVQCPCDQGLQVEHLAT